MNYIANTSALQTLDEQHHIHPFTAHQELWKAGIRVIEKAEGVYLFDTEGKRILDAMAGLWCVQIGYGNKDMAKAAYDAMSELSYYNTFFQTTTPYVTQLAHELSKRTPAGLDHIFFANSGSEAVDTALKLIWFYWNEIGKPNKKVVISRQKAYHGSTVAGASLCGLNHMHKHFHLPIPNISHIEPPPFYPVHGSGMTEDEFAGHCADALAKEIQSIGAENVAAFVGEPIMGAGGVLTPPEGYWPRVQQICRDNDVLLWSDEVICGFGRTGNWFGCETYGFEPDIMTMAKGLSSGYQPISGVALHDKVAGPILESKTMIGHGYTYSGHPVACAVALKNLEIIDQLGLVGKANEKNVSYFENAFSQLADHPLVANVRVKGMIAAFDIVKNKATGELFDEDGKAGHLCKAKLISNGAMVRSVENSMVYSPPLILSPDQTDDLMATTLKALDLTQRELQGA